MKSSAPKTTKKAATSADKIKVFVSTEETQGKRDNDFCWVPEGELVRLGEACDSEVDNPDSYCGCARCLNGLFCHKGTTTFKVALMDMTRNQYIEVYFEEYAKVWGSSLYKEIREEAEFLLDLANEYSEGSVFEYRAGEFNLRKGAKV